MKQRINSIDIVRGLIMVIMTLDHSRDFLHYPGNPPLDLQSMELLPLSRGIFTADLKK